MKTKTADSSQVKVNQLTSLTESEYSILLKAFDIRVSEKQRIKTLQGKPRKLLQSKEYKNSSLYGSEKKLNFMLIYLKNNMNQSLLGSYFSIGQAKVSQ